MFPLKIYVKSFPLKEWIKRKKIDLNNDDILSANLNSSMQKTMF